MMYKFLTLLPILLLAGCEGHYRYPCQDPANWGKLECNNEICKAEGTCTDVTLGRTGFNLAQTEDTLETVPSGENEISNDCVNTVSNVEPKTERVVKVTERVDTFETGNNSLDREVVPLTEEQPVTMNTVVDTAAHNAAAR